MSRVPQIVSRKKKRIFYGQADRKGVGVSPAGPDRLSDQGHHELSRKSDENKSFWPNQSAPSIYIMIETNER